MLLEINLGYDQKLMHAKWFVLTTKASIFRVSRMRFKNGTVCVLTGIQWLICVKP